VDLVKIFDRPRIKDKLQEGKFIDIREGKAMDIREAK
jgi:hypothetical protein